MRSTASNSFMATRTVLCATWSKAKVGALGRNSRSEEHTSELQSQSNLVCRLLLEKKKKDVVVTGASSGNGRTLACGFRRDGGSITIGYRSTDTASHTEEWSSSTR